MSAVDADELVPGLTVRLDQHEFTKYGKHLVKARPGIEEVLEEDRFHSFLLLKFDALHGMWLCTPLFSKWAPGSEQLGDYKSGDFPGWRAPSFISPYQQWMLPVAAIVGASSGEMTDKGGRSFYAVHELTELTRLAEMRKRNDAAWRVLGA